MNSPTPAPLNYAEMDGPAVLKNCGDSGERWAEAFQQIVMNKMIPIDRELMMVWFANVIEHSSDVRRERSEPRDDNYTLRLAHYWLNGGYPKQALDVLRNALHAAGEKMADKMLYPNEGIGALLSPPEVETAPLDMAKADEALGYVESSAIEAAREWLGDQGLEIYRTPGKFDAVAGSLAALLLSHDAATIERCAKRVKELLSDELGAEIASELKALKPKP